MSVSTNARECLRRLKNVPIDEKSFIPIKGYNLRRSRFGTVILLGSLKFGKVTHLGGLQMGNVTFETLRYISYNETLEKVSYR